MGLCWGIKDFRSPQLLHKTSCIWTPSAHNLGDSHQEHWTRVQFRPTLAVPVQKPYSHPHQAQRTPRSFSAILQGAGLRILLKRPPEFPDLLAYHHHTHCTGPGLSGVSSKQRWWIHSPNCCVAVCIHLLTFWRPFAQIRVERILSLGAGPAAKKEHMGVTWLIWKSKSTVPQSSSCEINGHTVISRVVRREIKPQLLLTCGLILLLKHRAPQTFVGRGRSSWMSPRRPQIQSSHFMVHSRHCEY